MQRIVITSCSQRKKNDENLLPAIERYDGPSFRLLRKYLAQTSNKLSVYILSAKLGLLSQNKKIPFYEQKLNFSQSQKLAQVSLSEAERFFSEKSKPKEIFINLGSLYLQAFEPTLERLSKTNPLVFASGSSGRRLAEMYDWLYGENSALRNVQPAAKLEEVFIQGVRLQTSENEIRVVIQNEITQNGMKDLQNYQAWFVAVDDLRISPKWLISRLTGLPVGKFHSDQARKILQKLGIKVQRV